MVSITKISEPTTSKKNLPVLGVKYFFISKVKAIAGT
jgi:hypothetical protein